MYNYGQGRVGELYWHVHHDRIFEILTEPLQTRQEYILTAKPENERSTRMRWLTPVQGKVPRDVLSALIREMKTQSAAKTADQAVALYKRHADVYLKAYPVTDSGAPLVDSGVSQEYHRLRGIAEDARAAWYRADSALQFAMSTSTGLRALHAMEHPGCPWDGYRLVFPEA